MVAPDCSAGRLHRETREQGKALGLRQYAAQLTSVLVTKIDAAEQR